MRDVVCLTTQSDDGVLVAVAMFAHDRANAPANAIAILTTHPGNSSRVVGVLTQEEVTAMGMLLGSGRAGMSALSKIEA